MAYSQRPSDILFPNRLNPNFKLTIDNMVYEIGESANIREETEEIRQSIDFNIELVKLIIEAIYKSGR